MLAEKKIIIENKEGLHARPAALFVQVANKYACEITVTKGNQTINGKSIMGILTLGAHRGTILTLETEGPDAEALMKELEDLLNKDRL